MPELAAVQHDLAARGVVLVTVVVDGNAERIATTAARAGLDAPILAGTEALTDVWQLAAVPWTVIFDRSGKAVRVLRGGQSSATLREAVTPLL